VDLLTKHWIFQWRGGPQAGNIWWIWDGYVGIETAINTGALFGLGQGRVGLFAAFSVVAIVGILYWLFVSGAAQDLLLTIALGCVFGGVLGNLYDRLGIWGHAGVRDWILLCYGDYTWPNFNIADSLLVCGAALLLWHGFRSEHHHQAAGSSTPVSD
jgi:signal peptidase II